jgi:NDP-sugar pyrophosphorylase family protein
MHLIWKRPDGFVNSQPSDFKTINLGGKYNFWLHKTEQDYYPFQISGDWQEADLTKKLNRLTNLLNSSAEKYATFLSRWYQDTLPEDASSFVDKIQEWIIELRKNIKGENWEKEIVDQTLIELSVQINSSRDLFLKENQ